MGKDLELSLRVSSLLCPSQQQSSLWTTQSSYVQSSYTQGSRTQGLSHSGFTHSGSLTITVHTLRVFTLRASSASYTKTGQGLREPHSTPSLPLAFMTLEKPYKATTMRFPNVITPFVPTQHWPPLLAMYAAV